VHIIEAPSNDYDNYIDKSINEYKMKRKNAEIKQECLNNIQFNSNFGGKSLKLLTVIFGNEKISNCLADTGSTHSLISKKCFDRLKKSLDINYQCTMRDMSVAGGTNVSNIIGETILKFHICDANNELIEFETDFLVAIDVNGYDIIIGSTLLNNENVTDSITPKSWRVLDDNMIKEIPLHDASSNNESECLNMDIKEIYAEVGENMKYINSMEHGNQDAFSIAMNENIKKPASYKDVHFGKKISNHRKKRIMTFLSQTENVFAKSDFDIGLCPLVKIHYDMNDDKIKPQKQRMMSKEKTSKLQEIVDKLVKADIVENYDAETPKMISNVVMVQKSVDHTKAGQFYTYHKDKTSESERKFRVTVDMTSLNIGLENTIKIQLTPPEDIIKNISGKYTTSLDIRQGFFHLEVDEESKRYQAFYCNNRIYTFKRMIQGVKLAPQAFTYVMSLVFSEETMKHVKNQLPSVERNMLPNDFSFVNVYIDDCFIFSESKELHEVHIKATILALIYGGFKLAPNKCTFFADKIKCLGFEVDTSNAEIGIDVYKIG